MKPLSLRFAPLLLLLLLLGCSTMEDASGKTPLGGDGPHVYGGMRTILSGGGFVNQYKGFEIQTNDPWVALMVMSPVIIDIGLSLFVDTLLLPWSLSK